MKVRTVVLSCTLSLCICLSNAVFGLRTAAAQATDLGGYVVGAGLGLLLGSVLYRNRYPNYNSSSNNGYSSSAPAQYQPRVVNGWYWDGFSASYGPIVVPPPGYVQPQQSNPAMNALSAGGNATSVSVVSPAAAIAPSSVATPSIASFAPVTSVPSVMAPMQSVPAVQTSLSPLQTTAPIVQNAPAVNQVNYSTQARLLNPYSPRANIRNAFCGAMRNGLNSAANRAVAHLRRVRF